MVNASKGKKTYRKSKKRSNTSWYNRKYSALEIAKKALAATRYMKGMINCEKKYHTTSQNTTFARAGVMSYLSAIPLGDSAVQREGNSVLLRSIYLNYSVVKNTSVATTKCKVAIVMDTGYADNAGSIAANLIWDSTYIGTQYAPMAPISSNTQGRYKLIRVWDFTLTDQYDTKRISEYIKVYKHLKFDGTAGTSADLSRNALYLVSISDQDVNVPAYEYICKIGFYDN